MRITKIHVENFKSLVDFDIDLAKFTCLIGLNGSGKSTVLQFIDFLSQQMHGRIDEWLVDRGWKASELRSKLTGRKNIEFEVSIAADNPTISGRWRAVFNPHALRCTTEEIEIKGVRLLEVAEGKLSIDSTGAPANPGDGAAKSNISFKYQGSILSQLLDDRLRKQLRDFKHFVQGIHSLDMLSPNYLRQRTRESAGSLGLSGQRLSSYLHELGPNKRSQLLGQLVRAYPKLEDFNIRSLRSGWKQLEITEAYDASTTFIPGMTTEARHINDGLLRLIAILAELQSGHQFVLFDEIENGINPELIEFVLNTLIAAKQQVMVTTHSPMILNYLEDDIARQGVIYLYKTRLGHTQAIPFFSIPSLAEKLTVMGPGEAFADTNLVDLADEIESTTETA
jgi:predicted ATPase